MKAKTNTALAMLGWFLLAFVLLLLGAIAAFERSAESTAAAIVLWVVSCALIVRRAIPILASLLAGE
jgi:hypothetical protein